MIVSNAVRYISDLKTVHFFIYFRFQHLTIQSDVSTVLSERFFVSGILETLRHSSLFTVYVYIGACRSTHDPGGHAVG